MRQELQALRQVALRDAAALAEAQPRLQAAAPGTTESQQLQGPMHQLPGGPAAGLGSAARQRPQSLMQQQPSGHAAAGHDLPGQQPEQQQDVHLHETQATGAEQLPRAAAAPAAEHAGYHVAGQQLEQQRDEHLPGTQASRTEHSPQRAAAYAAEHAEASRRAQPAEPLLQPQASSWGSRQAPGMPQDPQSRHQELLEAQRQVLAPLERALQPSAWHAALHGAPSHAQVEPDLPAVAPQASEPGSHGPGSFAAATSAADGPRLGRKGHGSISPASNAVRGTPRGSHEGAAHVMQQLQTAEGRRHPQQHQGLPLSQGGAADADGGQHKWGKAGQPVQQPGRGSDGLPDANSEVAAMAEERALSLSQWQKGQWGGDQQLMPASAAQPDESARHAQDPGVPEVQPQGAAGQPAATSVVPGAAGGLQQAGACDQQAEHRRVEPAGDPGGGLEGAQHPVAAGKSRPQHGQPAAGPADSQHSSRPPAEQRHQPVDWPEASEATQAEQQQQLCGSNAPQQPDRTQGVPYSPQHGRALEGQQQPDHFPRMEETASVRCHTLQGQQQTHGPPDMDVAAALQPGEERPAHGHYQKNHDSPHLEGQHDSPPMDAADALQLRGGLATEEQELLELQRDMQELEAQMAHAARCGTLGLTSCTSAAQQIWLRLLH